MFGEVLDLDFFFVTLTSCYNIYRSSSKNELNPKNKNPMRPILLSLILCFCATPLVAQTAPEEGKQHRLEGRLIDAQGAPVEYATLTLMRQVEGEPKLQTHAISSAEGTWSLTAPRGHYILVVTSLGYKGHEQEITLPHSGPRLQITMQERLEELQTLLVQGRPVQVKNLPTGFIVDVTEMRKTRNNALDLLGGLPHIIVQGDDLKVVGKGNIVLRIGNVLQRVEARELPDLLKGYDARLVKSVEVSLNPPLRYNADGNTAMITLHMISAFSEYFGGVVGAEAMPSSEPKSFRDALYSTTLFNRGLWGASLGLSGNQSGSKHRERSRYLYPQQEREVLAPSTGTRGFAQARLTLQRELGQRGNVGFFAKYNYIDNRSDFDRSELYYTLPTRQLDLKLLSQEHNRDLQHKLNATLYSELKFSPRGSQLWLDLSGYSYWSDRDGERSLEELRPALEPKALPGYRDRDAISTAGLSSSLDLYLPLRADRAWILELGQKSAWSQTNNRRNYISGSMPEQGAHFVYTEAWVMPYASLTWRPKGGRMWARAGLQLPLTWRETALGGQSSQQTTDLHLLPSLHWDYSLSERHRVFATLNSGLSRPQFAALNPFVWMISPNLHYVGNPDLGLATNYALKAGYSYRSMLTLGVLLEEKRSEVLSVPQMQGDVIVSRKENAQSKTFLGLTGSLYWDRSRSVSLSLNGRYGYVRSWGIIPALPFEAKGEDWNVNASSTLILNKARTLTAYLWAGYNGRQYSSNSTVEPQPYMGGGLRWSLMQRRLNLSLQALNLWTTNYKGVSRMRGAEIHFNNRYEYPTLYISVSYKFGKVEDKSPRKSLSSDSSEDRF